jgi:hypothetical protein
MRRIIRSEQSRLNLEESSQGGRAELGLPGEVVVSIALRPALNRSASDFEHAAATAVADTGVEVSAVTGSAIEITFRV